MSAKGNHRVLHKVKTYTAVKAGNHAEKMIIGWVISREIIKPSSPTPSHLQTYNLSELDQTFSHTPSPLLVLYPPDDHHIHPRHKAATLKQSLSHSLTKYYPFAGRLSAVASYVDCNDQGVVFVEAQYESRFPDEDTIVTSDFLSQLFAHSLVGPDSPQSSNVVGVQLNHFACGGLMLAVSMSHRIGDACTISSFLNHWAAVARYGSMNHKQVLPLNPHYIGPTASDALLLPPEIVVVNNQVHKVGWVMRNFVFSNSKLGDLKSKIIAQQPEINNPTRVEVLTSLLYKSMVAAATVASKKQFQSSCLLTMVDIRKIFARKLPQTSVGNLVSVMMVPMTRHPTETTLSFLVSEIKKAKLELAEEQLQSVKQAAENMLSKINTYPGMRSYAGSSVCGFPFYKADFGWGKPRRVICHLSKFFHSTGFLLQDSPTGDGIEAFVILEKDEMEIFQNDKEMLLFSSSSKFSRL